LPASAACRHAPEAAPGHLLWRPSRVCGLALWALALLAPLAVIGSDLPAALAWPLALLAGAGGARSARAYLRAATHLLVVPGPAGEIRCDGAPIVDLRVRWRGPLAFADWRPAPGARRQRLVFWPDVLAAAARRELRLALQQRETASNRDSVAA